MPQRSVSRFSDKEAQEEGTHTAKVLRPPSIYSHEARELLYFIGRHENMIKSSDLALALPKSKKVLFSRKSIFIHPHPLTSNDL